MLVIMWSRRNSHPLLVGMQNGTATLQVWQFLTKLNIILPCNLAIALLGIYPNELKFYVHTSSEKPAHGCLWQLYLQLPKLGSNQDDLQ